MEEQVNSLELEFKYNAEGISLPAFIEFCNSLKPSKKVEVSSWDFYYTNTEKGKENQFIRFRQSDNAELTIKRKTNELNNWERVEIDLPLQGNKLNESTVNKFVSLLNYKFNFKIFKSCFIYWFDNINIVYYVVYDSNLKEQGRFLEIEVNKEQVSNLSNPSSVLKTYEEQLKILNLKPANRLKKSLFEMFVK
jgi:adenylate cyclase class IV